MFVILNYYWLRGNRKELDTDRERHGQMLNLQYGRPSITEGSK